MDSYRSLHAWKHAHAAVILVHRSTEDLNLWIAFGSAAESECLVRAMAELGYLDAAVTGELEALLAGSMRTLRGLLRNPPRNPTHHAPRTTDVVSMHHPPRTTHV